MDVSNLQSDAYSILFQASANFAKQTASANVPTQVEKNLRASNRSLSSENQNLEIENRNLNKENNQLEKNNLDLSQQLEQSLQQESRDTFEIGSASKQETYADSDIKIDSTPTQASSTSVDDGPSQGSNNITANGSSYSSNVSGVDLGSSVNSFV